MNPFEMYPMEITKVLKETDIDSTFITKFSKPLKSGQFLQLSVPGFGEAPISISDFDGEELHLTIRKVGRVTDAIFNLKPGDNLHYRGPYGNGFEIDRYKDSNLFVITGGTGLAPVKQLVKHFINNPKHSKSFTLLSGFKSPDDILFKDEFIEWQKKVDLTLTVDSGDDSWNGDVGLVTQYINSLNLNKTENKKIIVVGPPPMMKFTLIELIKNGCKPEDIWVSFERNMSCGIGKCGHCKIDETYVCLEGPVFPYTKALELID